MPSYGGSNHGKEALKYITNKGPKCLVDLGCGHNDFVKSLREKGLSGTGVDFAYEAADIVAPMHSTTLPDNYADFITAFDSLEHLLPADVPLVFEEIKRICKPRAHYVFSISYVASNILVHNQNLHPTVRSEGWWMSEIRNFGTVVKMGKYLRGRLR